MIYTIGHSNHEIAVFISLLRQHEITAICDVRSHPYSRYVPEYSHNALKATLVTEGIEYVFLGKELGARSNNPACYKHGKVQFDLLSREPDFIKGIERVASGSETHRIALMCAEKDPLDCHRSLLVARKLYELGHSVAHIHADGSLESHTEMESRLLARCKLPEGDLFRDRDDFVAEAYLIQGERIAYQDDAMDKIERAAL